MLYYLLLPFNLVSDFINQGGVVLLALFFVAAYMWILISERLYFYNFNLDEVIDNSFNSYKKSLGKDEWLNSKIKSMSLADINLQKSKNLKFDIEIDGGINFDNSKEAIEAGANILVSGTTIFKSNNGDIKKNIELLKSK